FDIINLRGKSYLYNKMAVCINNYAANKPLDWGEGGAAAWPCAQPYYTPPGCQDSNGFHQFEWYDEIIRERAGRSLPLLSSESGVILNNYEEPHYPPIDEETHAQRSVEMCRLLMNNQVPYYYFNNAFWIMSTDDRHPFVSQRWFTSDGEAVLPQTIAAMKAMPKHPRELTPTFSIPSTIRVLMPDGSIEIMNLDEYVKGVLPVEMGTGRPLEVLKAQAIAARTYAITNRRHLDQGADVCTTAHCQVWRPEHYPDTDRAVEETSRLVAAYEDQEIQAFHFAHCDGRTRDSEDVWGQALPYCRSVPCIRPFPELKGHGVGMCQEGAIAMAEQGASHAQIIGHYYTGTVVVQAFVKPPPPPSRSVIRGRVIDEAGETKADVRVILRHDAWRAEKLTTNQGQFEFVGLPAGTFSLEVADSDVLQSGIQTDGESVVIVDLTVPPPSTLALSLERYRGIRLLIGVMPRPGIDLTVVSPWGHEIHLVSGSKPEFGPGGFETPIWGNGVYTIRFPNQAFEIEIVDETVIATFTEVPSGALDSRLTTDWMPLERAEEWLKRLEGYLAYQGLFHLEKMEATAPGEPEGDWKADVERRGGLRLLIGILPRPGIDVAVVSPWGHEVRLVSGSKPEYGPGGFETPIWNNGTYTIRFLDQSFQVQIVDETVLVTFTQVAVEGERARLVTDWLTQAKAEEWLQHFEGQETYRGLFRVEGK
ncbi:MAG: SpoIID/LytB domain-containing protein, partial [Anaerolineae bacterium]